MKIVDRIAPMIFIVPTEAWKTHSDIQPRNLSKGKESTVSGVTLYPQPNPSHLATPTKRKRRREKPSTFTFIPDMSAVMCRSTDFSAFGMLLRFHSDWAYNWKQQEAIKQPEKEYHWSSNENGYLWSTWHSAACKKILREIKINDALCKDDKKDWKEAVLQQLSLTKN